MIFNYVQIGTKNVDRLVNFYKKVLDCVETKDKHLLLGKEGVVLEAPGFKKNKIYFGIVKSNKGKQRKINDKGFAHLAFETVDVKAAVKRLVKYGGKFQSTVKNPENKPCVYCKDIDGNVVEFHIPFPSEDCKVGETLACLLHLKKDKGIRNETLPTDLKFIHVNSISDEWHKLCDFYNKAFESTDTGKMKYHHGKFKEGIIGVKNVVVIGRHVLLPHFYKSYPTIEIFSYSIKGDKKVCGKDDLGINMIGFKSDNLKKDLEHVQNCGAKIVKKIDSKNYLIQDINGSYILLNK